LEAKLNVMNCHETVAQSVPVRLAGDQQLPVAAAVLQSEDACHPLFCSLIS
jgi:hypothetical protein